MNETELQQNFASELEELKNRPFILETDCVTAWAVLCQLQLALRHPQNIGATAEIVRKVANDIIDTMAPEGSAMRIVAERGWDKAYDI